MDKTITMIIVEKLKSILADMVANTTCELQSWQYQSMAKGNVRLDTKMPNPTALFVQITDWSIDMTRISKREASEISVFFLDKETKLDNEAMSQDVIIDRMMDIATDFILRVMADRDLKIVDDNIKIKSVFYQSDSNRDGVCVQMRIETKPSCL